MGGRGRRLHINRSIGSSSQTYLPLTKAFTTHRLPPPWPRVPRPHHQHHLHFPMMAARRASRPGACYCCCWCLAAASSSGPSCPPSIGRPSPRPPTTTAALTSAAPAPQALRSKPTRSCCMWMGRAAACLHVRRRRRAAALAGVRGGSPSRPTGAFWIRSIESIEAPGRRSIRLFGVLRIWWGWSVRLELCVLRSNRSMSRWTSK